MKFASRAVAVAAIGTALATSIAVPASSAVTTLDLGSATQEYKGLIVSIPVTFACDAGGEYLINLTLQQVATQRTVSYGDASTFGMCTGEEQTATLRVRAFEKPFKKGPALAEVSMEVRCPVEGEDGFFEVCGSAYLEEEVRIRG